MEKGRGMGERRSMIRRLTRQEFLALGAGAGAAFVVAGCGGGGPENNPAVQQAGAGSGKAYNGPKVDLSFWNGFTGGDGPLMRRMVEEFSAKEKNINVTMNTVEWEVYYQKVPAAVSSGKGPDVAIMHIDTVPTNAARQVILPLDDVANALGLKEGDFSPPVVWEAGIYEGSRYGIPLDVHPFGFFYNKDVMEQGGLDPNKPPQTRDEFMGALEQLKGRGVQGFWVPTLPAGSTWTFMTMLWQYGGDLYNADATKATWNSQAGVDGLTWLVDVIEQGYSPKNVGEEAELVAFQNNENAFYWSGIWNINPLKEAGVNYGAVPLPQIGSEKGAWANSHNFVIPNKRGQDPNKIAAAKVFINYITTNSAEWAEAGQVPARDSARESQAFRSLELQSNLAQQLPYVHFPPPVPGIADVQIEALDPAVQEALLLKKEPKAALDESASQANQLLEENRQKYQA
jgi:multiple sugar transport system substrate-binding protein